MVGIGGQLEGALEPLHPARRDVAAFHASTLSSRRLFKSLFAGPGQSCGVRKRRSLADATLPLPQGGAQLVPRRPDRERCAPLAARVSAACALLSPVLLRAPQDRSRDEFRACASSWAVSWPRARGGNGNVGLVARSARGEERGRDVRVIGQWC